MRPRYIGISGRVWPSQGGQVTHVGCLPVTHLPVTHVGCLPVTHQPATHMACLSASDSSACDTHGLPACL